MDFSKNLNEFTMKTSLYLVNSIFLLILDNVHDMTDRLYPTTSDAQINKWSQHIKHSFDVVSENECAAHAALCVDGVIEFYIYDEPKCYLGDLSHVVTGQSETDSTTIRIHKKHALDHTNAVFDAQFPLPSEIWNRYMFEEMELQDGEDLADCGVKCEVHNSQCDFFAFSTQACYFGLYSQTDDSDVILSEDIQTYHKTGMEVVLTLTRSKYIFYTV